MSNNTRVIIVGGGIGGMCASIALRQRGIDSTLYERAAAFGEVGAGIQVWVKGMKALERLGVADRVRAAGAEVHLHQFFNDAGDPLYAGTLAAYSKEFGAPMPVMIRRPALIEALASGLAGHDVRFGKTLTSFDQNEQRVTVTFDDGSQDHADVLIAADGINSTIRRQLFPTVNTRTASYRYARAMATHPAPFGTNNFSMFFGRGDRIAIGDCGDDQMYWLVGLKNPRVPLDGPNSALKADLLSRFRSFPEGVASVIDSTPAEALIHHTVRDLEPIDRWGRGRVILLGDSAHATTPNLGRGSGEAMVDALVLAKLLTEADVSSVPAMEQVIGRYSEVRKPEAEELQRNSWTIGNIVSWEGLLSVKARDLVMKSFVGRKQIKNLRDQFSLAAQPLLV